MTGAMVNLGGTPIKGSDLAGYRRLMVQSVRERYTKERRRQELERSIVGQINNERELTRTNRYEMQEDQDWYHGRNYRDDVLSQTVPELRDLSVNVIANAVDYVIGTCKGLKLEGSVVPMAGSAYTDRQLSMVASEMDARLKACMMIGSFTEAKNRAITSGVSGGLGYWKTGIKHHPDAGKQTLWYKYLDYRNCYKDSSVEGMKESQYFYELTMVDADKLRQWYKDKWSMLDSLVSDYYLETPVDQSMHHYLDREVGHYSHGSYGHTKGGEWARPRVVFGDGWIRDHMLDAEGYPRDVVVNVKFAMDTDLQQCVLLRDPMFVYGHNEIPVTELGYRYRDQDRMPYSPLVRNRRGIQKTVRILARQILTHARSRGAIIPTGREDLPKGMTADQHTQDIENRLMQSIYVIPQFGDRPVQIIDNERRVEQFSQILQHYVGLSNDMTGIHPALLGNKSGVDAAVAMRKLADDAMRAQSGLVENLTRSVRESCEQTLSIIEQFAGALEFPPRKERGELVSMGMDGDVSIIGNRCYYQINPVTREETFGEAHLMLFAEVIKIAPQLGPSLLPYILRSMHMSDANDVSQTVLDLVKAAGLPVAPADLTEEERQQQAAQSQRQQQMRQAMQEAEIGKIQSEAQKNMAAAQKSAADATKPPDSEIIRELRDTIARQARELQQLKGL